MKSWPMILEPDQLEAELGNPQLVVVDLCHPDNYLRGHVPGAIHVLPSETQYGLPPGPGNLPDAERLGALIAKIGLSPEKHVVVYDDEGGGWAGRFIWLLESVGHHACSLLNGGLIAWVNEGHPCEQGHSPAYDDTAIAEVALAPGVSVSTEDLMALLTDDQVTVWDARSAEEYRGERLAAARGGHIPGAVNFEWTQAMDPSHNYRLKSLDRLREILTKLGIDGKRPIITHCQTHHRSGLTFVIGKALGYDIKAYPGSWSEWGNRADTPIDSETRVG